MIAYNHLWLNNLLVRKAAENATDASYVSKEEFLSVKAAYPENFYHPNFFVRTGLFILTAIIAFFSLGLVSLVIFSGFDDGPIGGLFIVYGLLLYAALELMVKKNHYKSGVDDALMWMAAGNIIGGLNAITHVSWLANAVIILLIAAYLFFRFTNAIMAGIASIALLSVFFLAFIRFGSIAKATAPFAIMIVAAGIYIMVKKRLYKTDTAHYTAGLLVMSVVALVFVCLAGNYYVVREASVAMFHLDLREGESIPMGWLFWVFTLAIPALYIFRGIQKKDPVLLRVGLLLVAVVVFTIRYYYHILPAEMAMVLGGSFFIISAYLFIKYLQVPKHGFTYKEQADAFFMDKLQVESLVIAQTFNGPALAPEATTQFGGGTGGGGGATGNF